MIAWRASPHGGPARVAIVGDSTVVGYTDNPEWQEPFAFGFRSTLASHLSRYGCEIEFIGTSPEPWADGVPVLGGGVDLRETGMDRHRGYGGIGLRHIAASLPGWLLADDPDVVLLQAGINSIAPGSSALSRTVPMMLDIIKLEVAIFAPGAELIVAQIAPYADPTPALSEYNRHVAAKFNSVDLASIFVSEDQAIDRSKFSNGINHPTNAAYAEIADAWAEVLLPVLNERGACRTSSRHPFKEY